MKLLVAPFISFVCPDGTGVGAAGAGAGAGGAAGGLAWTPKAKGTALLHFGIEHTWKIMKTQINQKETSQVPLSFMFLSKEV